MLPFIPFMQTRHEQLLPPLSPFDVIHFRPSMALQKHSKPHLCFCLSRCVRPKMMTRREKKAENPIVQKKKKKYDRARSWKKAIKPDKGTMEKDNCCNGTIASKRTTSSIILPVTIWMLLCRRQRKSKIKKKRKKLRRCPVKAGFWEMI